MKKKYLFIVLVLSVILNFSLSAQDKPVANKAIFAEFGGGGMIMSMNFDQRFNSNSKLGFGYRIGAGFGVGTFDVKTKYGYESFSRTYYTVPVGINYIVGKQDSSSSFEIGGGVSFLTRKVSLDFFGIYEEKYGNFIGYVNFMYRLTPLNSGYTFRGGLTPLINASGNLIPMGAVSFGYAF